MLRRTIDIGTHIEHHRPVNVGNIVAIAGRSTPLINPNTKDAHHAGARVAWADHGIGLAGLDQLRRNPDGGVLLLPRHGGGDSCISDHCGACRMVIRIVTVEFAACSGQLVLFADQMMPTPAPARLASRLQ